VSTLLTSTSRSHDVIKATSSDLPWKVDADDPTNSLYRGAVWGSFNAWVPVRSGCLSHGR